MFAFNLNNKSKIFIKFGMNFFITIKFSFFPNLGSNSSFKIICYSHEDNNKEINHYNNGRKIFFYKHFFKASDYY